MSVDDIVKLLDAIAKLLNVLVWPALLLFILIRFGRDLGDCIARLGEPSIKEAKSAASLRRKQAEVAAMLAVAAASRSDRDMIRESAAKQTRISVDVVSEVVTPRTIRRASHSTVLWVDDRPNNTIYERQALGALGVTFMLATSTDEALKKTSQQRFDAIISDMSRPSDPLAGYTLLDQLRANDDETLFIIYSSSKDPEHVSESRRHGAVGCTNDANELFEMVLLALHNGVIAAKL